MSTPVAPVTFAKTPLLDIHNLKQLYENAYTERKADQSEMTFEEPRLLYLC